MPSSTTASITANVQELDGVNCSRKRNQTTSSASRIPPERKAAPSTRQPAAPIGPATLVRSTDASPTNRVASAMAPAAATRFSPAAVRAVPRIPSASISTRSPTSVPRNAPSVFQP